MQGRISRYSPEEKRKKNTAQDAEIARLRKEAKGGGGTGEGGGCRDETRGPLRSTEREGGEKKRNK